MTKYRVVASYVTECYCDIEAENIEEAWDKAYNLDGGDYTPMDYKDDWQLERIEQNEN